MALIDPKQEQDPRDGRGAQPPVADPDSSTPAPEAPGEPPPPYGRQLGHLRFSQPGLEAGADVTDDGRININLKTKNSTLYDLLAPTIESQPSVPLRHPLPPPYLPPSLTGQPSGEAPPPPLNIVIQIVGSRGDVQPFLALGKILQEAYRHRVRIATHATFQSFVEDNGLEFFNIGGDPAELMAFMVKHPGLMPGIDALKSGEISRRRKGIQEMLLGCWRSCIEAGDGLGPPPPSQGRREPLNLADGLPGDPRRKPFVADAIIANPPSFAHIHVAEKLGLPLHLMFTMPWSPTRAFPHPLANVQSSNAGDVATNYMTYTLVEMMTWQGLGDVINHFRESVLDLAPLSFIWAPGLLTRLRIPYTYCWSPSLIPKPNDWGRDIDISGFYFLRLASNYVPDAALAAFLDAGSPPVYIGFGSIVVDDPNGLTRIILEAIRLSGVRALVSKGWGGLGTEDLGLPDGVFMLGNVPHDWLFKHVSCVVHHGGAGTTAAGLAAGKPTAVVPFFGDQPFWGAMIAKAAAGPSPVPFKTLTAEKLAEAIRFCLRPETRAQAEELGAQIAREAGAESGADSFHRHIDVDSLRCSLAPSRTAAWQVKGSNLRLCPLAATVLTGEGLVRHDELELYRSVEYNTEDQPPDPISAGASSLVGDMTGIGMAIADMPRSFFTSSQSADGVSDPTRADAKPEEEVGEGSSSPPEQQSGPAQETARRELRLEAALDAGRGVGRIVSTGVRSPMNFCLGLAKGFRNIPRLYNDDTVRPVEKVTDLRSGIKIAGKELGYGFLDGISGLVTQPMRGAEQEGAGGLVKGFGRGIGGLIAKPAAGVWGVPAYTMQGLHAEINSYFTKSLHNYIVASRLAQGEEDVRCATEEEKTDIVGRWSEAQAELKRFRTASKKGTATAARPDDDDEYERAIEASVRETSRGNAQEDAMIEAAIRESVEAVRRRDAEAMPSEEPTPSGTRASIFEDEAYRITDEEYQELVEQAIQQSLREQAGAEQGTSETSPKSRSPGPASAAEDEGLRRAMGESRAEMERERARRAEEETLLEQVKMRSLAEAEARRRQGGGGERGSGEGVESDEGEDLKRALEESLRLTGAEP